ncbi:hypothetical protein BDZ85DRAFT_266727 [Elsinoe ampelina]|uniref:Uncharacterized protein n=1 Tax=Elsinoe ampelina TaxID=302913 RepID=A0A6A6G453_9PEZI|nr:hypothetical protein BDZ85DRAFT_266727 [Elsinoe ampelina]
MKFISLATLSLATFALATPAAQDEGLAPAPTTAPELPGAGSGDSDSADRIKSLIDQFRSGRPGATGGAPFPRPTRRPRPTRSGRPSLPVPTGLSGFPSLGDLGSGLTERAPADEADFEGVARPTGRPGRPTRRPRPTGSFPRPRPTGAVPEEPEAPDAGDSTVAGASEEEEPVLGAARPTGRPSGPRPGRPTRRPRPTGGFSGFPRPTGGFPRPTGTPDAGEEPSEDLTKRTFELDEEEEVVEGAARPTGRPSRPRPGRPTRRPRPTGGFSGFPRPTGGFPRPTGTPDAGEEPSEDLTKRTFELDEEVEIVEGAARPTGRPSRPRPTGSFPGFPFPTGGFPRPGRPTPTGAADGEESVAGVALATGRPGRPRPGRPGRPVRPTGVVPGSPRPTGDYE